jgi:hypothetical protein
VNASINVATPPELTMVLRGSNVTDKPAPHVAAGMTVTETEPRSLMIAPATLLKSTAAVLPPVAGVMAPAWPAISILPRSTAGPWILLAFRAAMASCRICTMLGS